MSKIKKIIFVSLAGFGGLLLTLAGLNLIEISQGLILFTGVMLLITALFAYFFMD